MNTFFYVNDACDDNDKLWHFLMKSKIEPKTTIFRAFNDYDNSYIN